MPRVVGADCIRALSQIFSGLISSCLFGTAYTLGRHKTAMTSRALFPSFSLDCHFFPHSYILFSYSSLSYFSGAEKTHFFLSNFVPLPISDLPCGALFSCKVCTQLSPRTCNFIRSLFHERRWEKEDGHAPGGGRCGNSYT